MAVQHILFALVAVSLLARDAHAVACNGALAGTFAEVTVANGASCTLGPGTVTGSVLVSGTGSLTTTGNLQVLGSVTVEGNGGGGDITLGDSLVVLGDFGVTQAPNSNIIVANNANVSSVKIEAGGDITMSGITGSFEVNASGDVVMDGANVVGGGVNVKLGSGTVTVCDSTITGGISFVESSGDLVVVAGPGCGPTSITGTISSEKNVGSVTVSGAVITSSDFNAVEQDGSISVSQATFSDILVEKGTGSVSIDSITTESDTSIIENSGDVSLTNSQVVGDSGILLNGGVVTVTGNNFSNEGVSISGHTGLVTFSQNSNVDSLEISENTGGVVFDDNLAIGAADLSKNQNGVTITDSEIVTLTCADNSPAPTGSGNTVQFGNGQCSAF